MTEETEQDGVINDAEFSTGDVLVEEGTGKLYRVNEIFTNLSGDSIYYETVRVGPDTVEMMEQSIAEEQLMLVDELEER